MNPEPFVILDLWLDQEIKSQTLEDCIKKYGTRQIEGLKMMKEIKNKEN